MEKKGKTEKSFVIAKGKGIKKEFCDWKEERWIPTSFF